MSFAVIRIAKINNEKAAVAKTEHNYRLKETPNADQDAPYPNREYLNKGHVDYWTLAEQRIKQVVKRKTRGDQVRAVEIVMTGSPEGFKRDQEGRALDYSKSKWAQDNLIFLQEKFGKENVLSFTLHQDEKTPHIHAVITPITRDNRLSAKDLFGRKELVELQTDYAKAMESHGLSRGIQRSQAKHQPMSRRYGLEQVSAEQVAQLVAPIPNSSLFQLSYPPVLNRDEWKAKEEARINAELVRLTQEANQRLEKAGRVAQDNTAASEQVKILQKQLRTSESLKQAHFEEMKLRGTKLIELSVRAAQGDKSLITELVEIGKDRRERIKAKLIKHIEEVLKKDLPTRESFIAHLDKRYVCKVIGSEIVIAHNKTRAVFRECELTPNSQPLGQQLTAATERGQKDEQKRSQKRVIKR